MRVGEELDPVDPQVEAAPRIGLPSILPVTIDGFRIEIIWSILGAIILLALLSAIRRPAYRRRRYYR